MPAKAFVKPVNNHISKRTRSRESMLKLRVPLHQFQNTERLNTQQQEENLKLSSASRSRSKNQRSRLNPFISGNLAATTGARGMTISSNQFSVQSSSKFNARFNALFTQVQSTDEADLTQDDMLGGQYLQPPSSAERLQWYGQAALAQTQLSLKAKALDLRNLNMKSRNNLQPPHALTQRQMEGQQADQLEQWSMPDDNLGMPMQSSRTVQEGHQAAGLEDDTGFDNGNDPNGNIVIDNQQQMQHPMPMELSAILPPPSSSQNLHLHSTSQYPGTLLDTSSSFSSVRKSQNLLAGGGAGSSTQGMIKLDSRLTLVQDQKQRDVQNKKQIGIVASRTGAQSGRVQATIRGDGDDTVEESDVDIEDSDSLGNMAAPGIEFELKESETNQNMGSDTFDRIVQQMGKDSSTILQDESIALVQLPEDSTSKPLNDSSLKIKQHSKRNIDESSVEIYRDSLEQKQQVFKQGDQRRIGNSRHLIRAKNESSEFSNGQSTILKVLGGSGDAACIDGENSLYPLAHSFGGNEFSKFSIQRIDDAPYGQLFALNNSQKNDSGQQILNGLADKNTQIQIVNSIGSNGRSEDLTNPIDQLEGSDHINNQQEGAFITINEQPFEASQKHSNFQNLSDQFYGKDDGLKYGDKMPITPSYSNNTNDAIQKAVNDLIGFSNPKSVKYRDNLLKFIENCKAGNRDSQLALIEGRAAYFDGGGGNSSYNSHELLSEVDRESMLGELAAVAGGEQGEHSSLTNSLEFNRSLAQYRSLNRSRSYSGDGTSMLSEQVDLRDNLDLEISSSNLSQLQGPLEPAQFQEKDKFEIAAAASMSIQNQQSVPTLYAGTVYRYNYGFKLDFTERYLILNQDTLKYYRNQQHASNKKATNVPIVTVPMTLIDSIKEYRVSNIDGLERRSGATMVMKRDQKELYKNMFQIQLKDKSLNGGFYQLRQNEKVQDFLIESKSVIGFAKEADGKGLGALSHCGRSRSRGLQSDAGYLQRSQSPFMFGKSLLERSHLGPGNAGGKSRSKGSSSRIVSANHLNLPQMNVVAEVQSSKSSLQFNESIKQNKQDGKTQPKQSSNKKNILKTSGSQAKAIGYDQKKVLVQQKSTGLIQQQNSAMNTQKFNSKQPVNNNNTSRNNLTKLSCNSQNNGGNQVEHYSVSPNRLNQILKGPLIRNTRSRPPNDKQSKSKSKSKSKMRSTNANARNNISTVVGNGSQQKLHRKNNDDLAPLLQQISASITQVNMNANDPKKSIRVKKEELSKFFRQGAQAWVPGQLRNQAAANQNTNSANKFGKQRHNWNARLEQWERNEKQLIFACTSKQERKKIIKIIQKIRKKQDNHSTVQKSKGLIGKITVNEV